MMTGKWKADSPTRITAAVIGKTHAHNPSVKHVFVYDVYKCLLISVNVHIQNIFFIWILARSDPELVQNMFKSYFLSWGHPAVFCSSVVSPEQKMHLDFWDMLNLKKLHFCSYFVNFPTYECPSTAKCCRQ